MAAPQVELSDIKGPEGDRVRRLYSQEPAAKEAAPRARRVGGKTFQERSAPARASMRDRKRKYTSARKQAAQGRTRVLRGIRGAGKRTIRVGRTAHRAVGSPGAVVARIVGMFVGAGIVVSIVRNPAVITGPLAFIGNVVRAFTRLMGSGGSTAAPPPQNVARAVA